MLRGDGGGVVQVGGGRCDKEEGNQKRKRIRSETKEFRR